MTERQRDLTRFVTALEFCPDHTLVAGDCHGDVLFVYSGSGAGSRRLSLSPESSDAVLALLPLTSSRLVVSLESSRLLLLDTKTFVVLSSVSLPSPANALATFSDESSIAAACENSTLILFNPSDLSVTATLSSPKNASFPLRTLFFVPPASFIATNTSSSIILFDTASRSSSVIASCPEPILSAALSPDRSLLAVSSFQTITLRHIPSAVVIATAPCPGAVSLAFSPTCSDIIAATSTPALSSFFLATNDPNGILPPSPPPYPPFSTTVPSPARSFLCIASEADSENGSFAAAGEGSTIYIQGPFNKTYTSSWKSAQHTILHT